MASELCMYFNDLSCYVKVNVILDEATKYECCQEMLDKSISIKNIQNKSTR